MPAGNVGTSLLRALADDPSVDSVLGIARRRPELRLAKTEWVEADVSKDALVQHFGGADAVVPAPDDSLEWGMRLPHSGYRSSIE